MPADDVESFRSDPEIDRAYNPRLTIDDADALLGELGAASAAVVAGASMTTVAYGQSPAEYLDLFPVQTANAPVCLFIHGGFWRSFSARDYAFAAPPLAARGILSVVVNYALCPDVGIEEIVRQCRASLAWTYRNAAAHGGDPARIIVCGHSAGAHLAAMLAATDWRSDFGLPADVIKGVCAFSGLFELAPLSLSWLQPVLRLTPDIIDRCSPARLKPAHIPPTIVAVGEFETQAFHDQSADYANVLAGWGRRCRQRIIPGRNHIDLLIDLMNGGPAASAVVAAIPPRIDDG